MCVKISPIDEYFCYLYFVIIQIEKFSFNQNIYIFLKQSNAISIKPKMSITVLFKLQFDK